MPEPLHTHGQADAYSSPYPPTQRTRQLLWNLAWTFLCAWTPKPFNLWRLLVMRCFGSEIHGSPFVHPRARIQQPWNLRLDHRSCLGDRAVAYSLAHIHLCEGATIAQEAYLCTGTHDFSDPHLPLQSAPIQVGPHAFVAARAFILPGIKIGARALVGANSTVTKDVDADTVVAGSPARSIRKRLIRA